VEALQRGWNLNVEYEYASFREYASYDRLSNPHTLLFVPLLVSLQQSTMAREANSSAPGLAIAFVLIYAIIGPAGLLPTVLCLIALTLARVTPVLEFLLNEHESYHGSTGGSLYRKLKEELFLSIRKDLVAQLETQKADLLEQVAPINEELDCLRREAGISQGLLAKANTDNDQLRASQLKARKDIDALRLELERVKRDLEANKDNEKAVAALLQSASLPLAKDGTLASNKETSKPTAATNATPFTFGAVTPAATIVPFSFSGLTSKQPEATQTPSSEDITRKSKINGSNAAINGSPAFVQGQPITPPKEADNPTFPSLGTPTSHAKPTPQPPISLTIQLPTQLQRLDPTRSGFKCIGRAIASHGGPCGSFSDQYLPQSGRRAAAETLKEMRAPNPSAHLFERALLKKLADNMLCIRHCSGTRHDQSGDFAQDWYDDLEEAREQLRRWKDGQKFAAAPPSEMMWTQSTSAPWVFSAQPMSPASSVTSMSGDAGDDETMYDRPEDCGWD
jgi:hypothetical protein